MSRVESASGSKYSAQKEKARKFEPIAPVGTNYAPIGKVDIAALRKGPAAGSTGGIPAIPAKPPTMAPTYGGVGKSAASLYGNTVIKGSAPADAWPDEAISSTPPPPPPATSRPPAIPSAPRPAFSVSVLLSPFTLRVSNFLLTAPYLRINRPRSSRSGTYFKCPD